MPNSMRSSIVNLKHGLHTSHPDHIVIVSLGSFCETTSSQAEIVAKVCKLKLNWTWDEAGQQQVPTTGFHEVELGRYCNLLCSAGYSVIVVKVDTFPASPAAKGRKR